MRDLHSKITSFSNQIYVCTSKQMEVTGFNDFIKRIQSQFYLSKGLPGRIASHFFKANLLNVIIWIGQIWISGFSV